MMEKVATKKAKKQHKHYTQGLIEGIEYGDLNQYITTTDFTFDDNGNIIKMVLCAGFLGVSQNPTTHTLRPSMGWFIARKK